MLKYKEVSSLPPGESWPTALPLYEEAIMKQPAHNPNAPLSQDVAVTTQPHIQAASAGQPAAVPYTPAPPMVSALNVGFLPVTMVCPHCQKQMTTTRTASAEKSTHIAALVLCLLGCWLCCCIPYCLFGFKEVHHWCSECQAYIGTYRK